MASASSTSRLEVWGNEEMGYGSKLPYVRQGLRESMKKYDIRCGQLNIIRGLNPYFERDLDKIVHPRTLHRAQPPLLGPWCHLSLALEWSWSSRSTVY